MWKKLQRNECRRSDWTLPEETFQKLLRLEWKRSSRSQKRFVLMLLEPLNQAIFNREALTHVLQVLPASTRETDIVGWYKDESVIGIMFTEIGTVDDKTVRNVLTAKIAKVLNSILTSDQAVQIRLSFQMFPSSEVADNARAAGRYRDIARGPRHEETPAAEALALGATNSSK
jgi:hypothetical protein